MEAMREGLRARYPAFDPVRLASLAVVGAGDEGARLVRLCEEHGIEVALLVDEDPAKQGARIEGHPVEAATALSLLGRDVPVVVASHRVLGAARRIEALGFTHVAPFALLQVLDPRRFPPHVFYEGWLEDLALNRERYEELFARLADDLSRRTLAAVLRFRLTLDPTSLAPVLDPDLYAPAGLFRFKDDEVVVDGGAYDGDSVRAFIERTGGRFSRVLAFEPDPATHARLAASFADEPRVVPINGGLAATSGVRRFRGSGSRGSAFADHGEIEVPVAAVDDVLGGSRVTFIKMNIEGAEQDALAGCRRAIARWAPKLAISAYHRPSDLWGIPALVHELRPEYRLYLRQHDGGVIETVLYAR